MTAKSIKSGLIWRVSETVGSEVVSFCVFAVLARVMAPEEFGAVAIAVAIVGVLQISLYHGWIEALITDKLSRSNHQLKLSGTLDLGFSIVIVIVFALLAVPIGLALNRPLFAPILWALLPTLVLRALCTSMLAQLRLEMQFRATALRTLVGVVFGGVVAYGFAHVGFGYWALVIQQWAVEITGFLVLALSTRRKLITFAVGRLESLQVINKVLPVMLSQLLSQSLRRLDLIILGLFLNDHAVGLLFLVNRLIYAGQMVTQHALADVALVVLSKHLTPGAEGRSALRDANRVGASVGCMAFVILALVGAELIPLVFGKQWDLAADPFIISCIGAIFGGLTAMISTAMLATERTKVFAKLNALVACLRVLSCIFGAYWGLMGIAVASALASIFGFLLFTFFQARAMKVRLGYFFDGSVTELVACGILILAWFFFKPNETGAAIIAGLLISATTVCIIILVARPAMLRLATIDKGLKAP